MGKTAHEHPKEDFGIEILVHLGYIIVPMGYANPGVKETTRGGTPYGPSSVTGLGGPIATDIELQICRDFGRRLAETTKKLRP